MCEIINQMKPLDDVMRKNNIYLALREPLGSPDPPRTEILQMKVLQ